MHWVLCSNFWVSKDSKVDETLGSKWNSWLKTLLGLSNADEVPAGKFLLSLPEYLEHFASTVICY